MPKPTLIFDGDCSFCSSSARALKRMIGKRVQILPYQRINLEDFSLTQAQCNEAVQFAKGPERSSGHEAIADALIAGKNLWSIAGWIIRLPVISSVGFLVYGWVSKNRHRLPGGTPACSID